MRIKIELIDEPAQGIFGFSQFIHRAAQGADRGIQPAFGLICGPFKPAQRIIHRALCPVVTQQ